MPPEAQIHLLNAQRELILALSVTVDHHMRERRGAAREEGGTRRRRPVRVELD